MFISEGVDRKGLKIQSVNERTIRKVGPKIQSVIEKTIQKVVGCR